MAVAHTNEAELAEQSVRAFLHDYAEAWWAAEPSALRDLFTEDASYVCRITTSSLGNSIEALMEFVHGMSPAPPDKRKLTIEHVFVEPDASFARATLLLEGLMLHEFTLFPVADHLHLAPTDCGWKVVHAYATPRAVSP